MPGLQQELVHTPGSPQSHTSLPSTTPLPHLGPPMDVEGTFNRQVSWLVIKLNSALLQLENLVGTSVVESAAMIQPVSGRHSQLLPVVIEKRTLRHDIFRLTLNVTNANGFQMYTQLFYDQVHIMLSVASLLVS